VEGRHFLSTYGLSVGEIESLLELAEYYCRVNNNSADLPLDVLRGKMLANLFFEPSTRTRLSFARAAGNLGGEMLELEAKMSSVIKGEGVLETAMTLQAMGVDALVVRHAAAGVPAFLARHLAVPVINAGDGSHEHPTQALLDLLTIRQEFGRLEGLSALLLGDIRHSRVARSNLYAMRTCGLRVRLAGPPTLVPEEMTALGAELAPDVDDALREADVVYVLRIQHERRQAGMLPSLAEYRFLYGIDARRQSLFADRAIIMHPGPINIGVELTAEAYASARSRVQRQVNNGVAVRMAVLHHLLSRPQD
jgi:aspartate carbamoyltransferase catalytic subunit